MTRLLNLTLDRVSDFVICCVVTRSPSFSLSCPPRHHSGVIPQMDPLSLWAKLSDTRRKYHYRPG